MPPSGHNTMRKSYPKNSGKNIFGYIIFGEFFLREKFFTSVPPSVPQGLTNIPKCTHRATTRWRKSYPKNSGKNIFGYIIFGQIFLREHFSPQYPLASPRGSQISLNAPIGPQHDEKKLSEKFRKKYFRIYNFWGKFFA